MLRLTSRNEFIAAIVLVAVGAQNLFVARAFGLEEFPGYLSWVLMVSGLYLALVPIAKAPRDLGSSFIIVMVGVTGLYFGTELTMGTAGRMGPGYFPRILSWLVIAMGAGIGLMGLNLSGPPVEAPKFRPMLFVLISIMLFGYLMNGFTIFGYEIPGFGLAITAVIVVLVAALARREFKLVESLLLGVGLSVATVLIFVYGLGQPLPDCPNGARCAQWLFGF